MEIVNLGMHMTEDKEEQKIEITDYVERIGKIEYEICNRLNCNLK